jgi:ubiquitin-protein ligase
MLLDPNDIKEIYFGGNMNNMNAMNAMQPNNINPMIIGMNNMTLNFNNNPFGNYIHQMTGIDRIIAEFNDLCNNPMTGMGLTLSLVNESDYRKWRITLIGPNDTSYKNGLFIIEIAFPEKYPECAPEAYFITPIYHVNINPKSKKYEGSEELGHINIAFLNWWKPEKKMRDAILSIFALFYMNNPDEPYGIDRAVECHENRPLYEEKIKYFTKKYANPMSSGKYDRDHDWNFNYP